MSKYYVGRRMSDFEKSPEFLPVSRVTIWYDDENAFTAGNDTGRTIEIDCPWATQQMANDVLSKLQGFVYRPYTAQNALLSTSADLGDAVTANGLYSLVATLETDYGGLNASNISAPEDEELDHEYPYESRQTRQSKRVVKLGQSYFGTKITRAEGLVIEKTDGETVTGKVVLNSDELTFYAGSQKSLYFDPVKKVYRFEGELNVSNNFIVDKDGNVTIKGDLSIPSGSILFSSLSSSTQSQINSASSNASEALESAQNSADTISGWTYGGTTMIDGSMIQTGTVRASILEGGEISLIDYRGNQCGSMTLSPASTGSYAVGVDSDAAMRLQANDGSLFLRSSYSEWTSSWDVWIELHTQSASYRGIRCSGDVLPASNSGFDLGNDGYRWNTIYSSGGLAQTSDRSQKEEINYDISEYDAIFDMLKPCSYRMANGTRRHIGLIAQDVEEAMMSGNVDSSDFAALIIGENGYSLRYSEFIPLLIRQIQDIKKRIENIERV